MKKFWEFKNSAGSGNAELLLYGEIQSERSWFDFGTGGIFADEFVQDLQLLGSVNQITVRINSVGGDIFAAVAIFTQLKMHAAKVICIVDGLAASAATLILMAGDEIQMPTGSMLMIHDPLAVLIGTYNADDLAKQADTLNTIKESIVAIYSERTGTSKDKLASMMAGETWMTADDAIKLGFADTKISAEVKTQMKGKVLYMNGVKHDLTGMKSIPEDLLHAQKITDIITENGILGQFVAMAGATGTAPKTTVKNAKEADPADPEDPEDPNDPKAKKNAAKAKVKDDEDIDDEDAEDDEDEDDGDKKAAKDKKAKKAVKNLATKYPNIVNRIINMAKADERERIKQIDAISGQIGVEMANKAKFTDMASAKDVLFDATVKGSAKSNAAAKNYLANFQADVKDSNVKNVGSAPNSFTDNSAQNNSEALGKMIADAANKIIGR